jgi:uncharacterized membrane protein
MIQQLRLTSAQIRNLLHCRFTVRQVALLLVLFCAGALYAEPVAAQATFTPLGQFGGIRSGASDISADGSVIVGTSIGPGALISVFRLTPQGSTVRSTGLTGSEFLREPSVSDDGSTVVGTFQSSRGEEAFRWLGDAPFEGLGDLPGGIFHSNAFGLSADGSVVVGASEAQSRFTAFRWTVAGGIASLGGDERTARTVSADGAVVAGGLWVTDDTTGPAYRWTTETGSIELPALELPPLPLARFLDAESRTMTPDGAIVVGFNQFRAGTSAIVVEAFRWTQQEGTTSLNAPGWGLTVPYDVSADGSVVVGSGANPDSTDAFIWTAQTGMLNLRDVLIFGGAANLDGWRLISANGISADGRTVVGTASGPIGQEAFVATIGAIPEPSGIVLATVAVAGIVGSFLLRRPPTRRSLAQPCLSGEVNPVFQERDHG